MAFAYRDGETWREADGPFVLNGLGYPYNWPDLATDEERADAGVVAIVEADATVPSGKVLTGFAIVDVAGAPTRNPVFADAPVPAVVDRVQGRLQLLAEGKLATVDAAIAGADAATQEYWASTAIFRRDNATLMAMWAALGWSDAELDATFTAAAAIPT